MVKKNLFIGLLYACVLAPFQVKVYAQPAKTAGVSGRVVSVDKIATAGISVSIKGSSISVVSSKDGAFMLMAPVGKHILVVSSMIIHPVEIPITVEAGKELKVGDIQVRESCPEINEVVVTGQYSPQSLRNSLYKIRVINSRQIQQKAATNLQTLLNSELGIRLSNDMALGETNFEIMGMSGNNVKVLLDGVPMIDRTSTKQSLSQIDINSIERVEIVEGPMSVIYGADALAGVVNIITKKNATSLEKPFSAYAKIHEESIGSEYDLFGGEGNHIQHASAEYYFKNKMFVNGSFTRNDFGGWQGDSTGRKKQWQPREQYLFAGKVGYASEKVSVYGRLDYLNEMIVTKSDVNSVTNTTSDMNFFVDRYTGQLQGNWKVNRLLDIAVAGSYQDYRRKTETVNIDLNTGKKTLSREDGAQAKINYNDYFARATATWRPLKELSVQPGVEFQSTNGGGDRIDGEHRINNTALFVSAEYKPLEWLSLRPGMRKAFSSVYDVPWAIPSLNVKASINSTMDLRLSYGRGFRAPTLQELYYSFHNATHDIDGNPDLKAENSNSYMLSYLWRAVSTEHVRYMATLSGFYNDYHDRIATVRNETTGFYQYQNINRYKTVGFTLENTFVYRDLKVQAGFSYVGRYNSLYKDETYAGESMSEFRFSPEVTANASYDWDKVATFAFYYKMTGKRHEYVAGDNNSVALRGMSSFNWADFTVSRRVCKYVTAQAGVKNIFDITTVRNTSSGSAHSGGTGNSQLACGRSYFVALSFQY